MHTGEAAETHELHMNRGATADELLRALAAEIPGNARLDQVTASAEGFTATWTPPSDDSRRPYFDHSGCDHEATPTARAACRRERAKAG